MQYDFLTHAVAFVLCFLLLESLTFGLFMSRPREVFAVASGNTRLTASYAEWEQSFRLHGFLIWQLSAIGTYFLLFARG